MKLKKYVLPVLTFSAGICWTISAVRSTDPYDLAPLFNLFYYAIGLLLLGAMYFSCRYSYKKGHLQFRDQLRFSIPLSILILTLSFVTTGYLLDKKTKERDRQYELQRKQQEANPD